MWQQWKSTDCPVSGIIFQEGGHYRINQHPRCFKWDELVEMPIQAMDKLREREREKKKENTDKKSAICFWSSIILNVSGLHMSY
jgi:hypothetical protein